MPDSMPSALDQAHLRQRALSRWDNEGGATLSGRQDNLAPAAVQSEIPPLTDVELVQLRVRVIALENVVISLLAQSSDRQLDLVHDMAAYISPRPGFTHHPLTIRAAAEMVHLVERAAHFRGQDGRTRTVLPYKHTPVFDEITLPSGLRRNHRTKPGVWAVIRVLDGRLRYQVLDPVSESILDVRHPGLVSPEVPHRVEPLGPMRMQVEFYTQLPDLTVDTSASTLPAAEPAPTDR